MHTLANNWGEPEQAHTGHPHWSNGIPRDIYIYVCINLCIVRHSVNECPTFQFIGQLQFYNASSILSNNNETASNFARAMGVFNDNEHSLVTAWPQSTQSANYNRFSCYSRNYTVSPTIDIYNLCTNLLSYRRNMQLMLTHATSNHMQQTQLAKARPTMSCILLLYTHYTSYIASESVRLQSLHTSSCCIILSLAVCTRQPSSATQSTSV